MSRPVPSCARPPSSVRSAVGTLLLCLGLLLATLAVPAPAARAAAPPGFAETVLSSTLRLGTGMAFAPDGRLFVLGQDGVVRIVADGRLLPTPFLTIPPARIDAKGERGLAGIAFDPAFASNGYVYLYYTAKTATASQNRISRFVADGDVARTSAGVPVETTLVDLDPLAADSSIHNGGALAFGPDGRLYATVGDNGLGVQAQSLGNRFGKVLRLNRDGSIPADNPFVGKGATGANQAIWARGLRNPFSLTFSRAGTMLINDVGQDAWEEVNVGRAGADYGWPTTEGPTTAAGITSPLYAYPHAGTGVTGCAITGGSLYEPTTPNYPSEHVGDYFFADYCSNWIKRRDASGTVTDFVTSSSAHPVDVETSPDGDVYYLTRRPDAGSTLVRVDFLPGPTATITGQPSSVTVSVGEPAAFSVTAVGAAPLGYQWQRDGTDIAGATAATYRLPSTTTADSGARFRVVVRNATSRATSADATLTVTTDRRPAAAISTPSSGATYAGGEVVRYSGTGTDPEAGALPATSLRWRVDFHHAAHTHPFLPPTTGAGGSFTIPTGGHLDGDVWYRVHLDVVDGAGLVGTAFRDVVPRTAALTVATSPSGLRVDVDGQPRTAPHTESAVVGLRRSLSAPSVQTLGGDSYAFAGWSDGGGAAHTITVPDGPATFTARYRRTLTLTPDADTMARQQAPTTASGSLTTLSSDSQETTGSTASRMTSYLRFTVPPLRPGESVAGARLGLQVTNGTADGPAVFPTSPSWAESTLTWASGQPARTPTTAAAVGDFGAMATGRVSTPVSGVTGAGAVALQLHAESGDGLQFASRESTTAAARPQLVLSLDPGAAAGPSAPTAVAVVKDDAARTATVTWSPPASDGGSPVTGYRVSRDGTDTGATGPYSTLVPSTSRTSTLTRLLPGSTYRVSVQAVTAVGTGPAGTGSVTLAGRTLVLTPTADTTVREQAPTSAAGAGTTLYSDARETTADAATRMTSYLRFSIPALAAGESITAAQLRVSVTNATSDGPAVWRTATAWNESTTTWASGRPARSGTAAIGDFAAMAAGTQVSARLSGVTGAGLVSLELHAAVDDGVQVSSREGVEQSRPQLFLSVAPPPP